MSTLSNKIASYSPEQFIRFNTAYSLSPTNIGSGGTAAFSLSNEAPVLNPTGGPDGEGSWQFNPGGNNDATPTRFQISTTAANVFFDNETTDADFTAGMWFKFETIPTTATSMVNGMRILELTTKTKVFSAQMTYSNTSEKGKISIAPFSGSIVYTTNRYDDNQWHYLAIRLVSSTANTFDSLSYYIDGQLIQTFGTFAWGVSTSRVIRLGDSSQTATSDVLPKYELSNLHITPSSVLDATAITEIWTAAQPGGTNITVTDIPGTATALMVDPAVSVNSNAILSETPATASAMFAEPTIIVVTPNTTQITTSIVASVLFPDATVQTSSFVNNVVDPLLASTIIGDNVDIIAATSVSYSTQEMTASADIVQPFLPQALTASATFVNPTVTVPQSYFNFVKANNPLIYINEFPTGNAVPYVNYGSLTLGVIDKGPTGTPAGVLTNIASGDPLSVVGDGFSLGLIQRDYSSNETRFQYTDETLWASQLSTVYASKNWTHEFWYKPKNNSTIAANNSTYNYLDDHFRLSLTHTPTSVTAVINFLSSGGTTTTTTITNASSLLTDNAWHNVSLVASSWSATQIRLDLYIDSVFVGLALINFNHTYNDIFTALSAVGSNLTWNLGTLGSSIGNYGLVDEIAVYPSSLSSQTLSTKYNFVDSISPNRNVGALPSEASALMLNATVIIVSNVNNQETPSTASALFVQPEVSAGRTINATADPMLASATNVDATAYWGRTYYATPMISSAESKEGFVLNDIYYQYVQTNIAPYRYVTFDAADTLLDYGSDNDYSVAPTTIGGTIVNPDLGINGKSAKTAGTSYVTDGVILNESEWNDSWGTGSNDWHSAFWFQRAADDTSTTGLRVLWNLNGYKDNKHIILYQYLGKISMQVNNDSGTWLDQDTGVLDLFDYNRHFVVIEHDHHGGSSNIIKLYVDAVLRFTVDIGSLTPTTTNAASADSGPNTELNNRPRLSVGCLITPFMSTALAVVPTNTKLIIDEIYWDKNLISQTSVTNLFSIMPGKFNINKTADPMLASDELIMPAFATTVNFVADPFTASASFVQPLISADRLVVYTANAMTATGLMSNAEVNENRTIYADVMLAIATFNNPGIQITIPGGPMLASAEIGNRPIGSDPNNSFLGAGIRVNGNFSWLRTQPWAAWLRATDSNTIIPTKEVV